MKTANELNDNKPLGICDKEWTEWIKSVQIDALQSCLDLCKEGAMIFKNKSYKEAAIGCNCCADNIELLINQCKKTP